MIFVLLFMFITNFLTQANPDPFLCWNINESHILNDGLLISSISYFETASK